MLKLLKKLGWGSERRGKPRAAEGLLRAERPLHSLLDRAVREHPERTAIDFLDKTYSYAEIGDLVNRAAKGLRILGVKKGVRVGLFLPNTPYYVIFYFAILKAGGTVVNFNPLYAEREILQQIEDSECEIMVTLDVRQLYPKVAAALERTCLSRIIVCPMRDILPPVKSIMFQMLKRSEIAGHPHDLRHISFDLLIGNDGKFAPVEIDTARDVAVLQYTGGTTGLPKAAMLTHANLAANARQVSSLYAALGAEPQRVLAVLPLFHVFAMTVAMNYAIGSASQLILLPRFNLDQLLKVIAAKRPTVFPGVPSIYTAINGHAEIAKFDLSSLKACISGGAPLPTEVKRRFEKLTGCNLVEGYGLSEASPVVTCNRLGGPVKDGSIGSALPETMVEIRSLEQPGKVVEPGEPGEICVKGPQVMAGYWKRPEETERILQGGVLHTGDVGYVDADGFVFIVDRIKDLIICNGYKVYPRAIEDAIYLHADVEEVTVIGVPDPARGQSPKAFIKLRAGKNATDEEMRKFLADKLSPMEMPREIEFRDKLPKSLIGKLSKKELMAEQAVPSREAGRPAAERQLAHATSEDKR
jgi:long-chain acyl-CoA synthetase